MAEPFVTRDQIYDVLDQEQRTAVNDRLIDDLRQEVHSDFEQATRVVYVQAEGTRALDGLSSPRLMLPDFGARRIMSVTEAGVLLATSAYELEPVYGRYLTRLDVDGVPINWVRGRRNITVVYFPAKVPAAVVGMEREEVVRRYQAARGGYMDQGTGVGTAAIRYTGTFTQRAIDTLAAIRENR